jgi:hypothetical protein
MVDCSIVFAISVSAIVEVNFNYGPAGFFKSRYMLQFGEIIGIVIHEIL